MKSKMKTMDKLSLIMLGLSLSLSITSTVTLINTKGATEKEKIAQIEEYGYYDKNKEILNTKNDLECNLNILATLGLEISLLTCISGLTFTIVSYIKDKKEKENKQC